MIYDCFQFFNELDMLKIRMHIMDPIVDYFVISEANETFSGLPKPYYYEENKEMFSEFADKIIHVTVTDTPEGGTHERDTFQKNAVTRGLQNCTDDDIIIFSDLDEIPNPEEIQKILDAGVEKDKVYHFAQRLFYCYLNMEEVSGKLLSYAGDFEDADPKKWIGSKMLSYQLLREKGWQLGELRFPDKKEYGIRVDNGGWHFGYMGGHGETDIKKRVREKVISAAHQEYNNRRTLDRVEERLLDGQDIFGRDARFVRREIDETYPLYIRTHREELAHLILQEESEEDRQKRQQKQRRRDRVEEMLLPFKRLARKILRKGN
ncbi:MAG: glycosyl transferase GT17 family protein [Lachnospiraceae bacterium]|nr:glycosyl transferase GT17 family protein [Lachnospiraceae bacterium]